MNKRHSDDSARSQRLHPLRVPVVGPLIVLAVAASMLYGSPSAQAVTTSPGGTMLIGEESSGGDEAFALESTTYHDNGMQVGNFTNGVAVAGSGNEVVSYTAGETVEANGEAANFGAVDVNPGPDDEPTAGWTSYDALVALGATATDLENMGVSAACPHIDESLCVTTLPPLVQSDGTTLGNGMALASHSSKGARIGDPVCQRVDEDNPNVRAYGCAERKWMTGPGDHEYVGTVSRVTGASKFIRYLVRLRTSHLYTNSVKIVDWRPIDDLQHDRDCEQRTLKLEYNGVGASSTGTICREKWDMTHPERIPGDDTSARFTNSWYKFGGVNRADRSAVAVDRIQRTSGDAGFKYRIYYTWSY